MSLFGFLAYHIIGKSSFKQTTALLSNDPDNDRSNLYLALVSLTDSLSVVVGRRNHKQNWQSLDKYDGCSVDPTVRISGSRDRV